jgi:hypothetical protein
MHFFLAMHKDPMYLPAKIFLVRKMRREAAKSAHTQTNAGTHIGY